MDFYPKFALIGLSILWLPCAYGELSECDEFILAEVARAEKIMRTEVEKNNVQLDNFIDPKNIAGSADKLHQAKLKMGTLMANRFRKPILEAQAPLAMPSHRKQIVATTRAPRPGLIGGRCPDGYTAVSIPIDKLTTRTLTVRSFEKAYKYAAIRATSNIAPIITYGVPMLSTFRNCTQERVSITSLLL